MRKGIATSIAVIAFIVIGVVLFANTLEPAQTPIESQSPVSPNTVVINVPAIDNQGNGIIARLKVQAIPGEGRVLTNINDLLFWVDTQNSIRVAERVAANITGKDLSKVDLIYTIETNATVIEGPSAGAALAVATVAVLENKSLNPDAMITGTINPDGTIGPVGGVLEKAQVSKDSGANVFLVPEGQNTETNFIPEKTCEKIGFFTFCRVEYKPQRFDMANDIGIEVIEVDSVEEALKYFFPN